MAALPVNACLLQGDFLDGVVESALRSMVKELKEEYRKEIRKALEATKPETTYGAGIGHVESPLVALAPPLNTPLTEHSEDQLRLAGELQAANGSGPPVMDNAGGCMTCPPARGTLRLPPESGAWGESRTSNMSNIAGWICEEAVPTRRVSPTPVLTEHEQQNIKNIREEEIAKEKAVLARQVSPGRGFVTSQDEASWCRMLVYNLISSPKFDFGMGFVILLNALTIGLETSISRHGGEIPVSLKILEYTFVIIYCVELAMGIYVGGVQKAFSNNWVRFDAVMVAAGILNLLISVASLSGVVADAVNNVNMLKMLRLVRLAKTVRVLVQFRTLWMLVQGLMYAVLPMFWTAILMGNVIYVFAVVAMETITASESDDDYNIAAQNYNTIGESMLTLMQFMTLDSSAAIYRPLISAKPWLIIYFVVFILLGPIALMNIVTAIMVESSLRTASEDQEAKKAWDNVRRKNMMPKLRNIFLTLDTSGDGEVDIEEVFNAPPEIKDAIQHIVGLEELEEVFNLIDYDGSGGIDIEEFVDGIMRSQSEKPPELFVLIKQNKMILERLNGLGPQLHVRVSAEDGAPHSPRDRPPPHHPAPDVVSSPGPSA